MRTDRYNSKDYSTAKFVITLVLIALFLCLKFMGYLQFL